MDSKRILITGLSSWWGGRLAQMLEREPGVDAVVGVDSEDPRHALDRTEFVRVEPEPGVLRRIITATGIDTVIDTRLLSDPLLASAGHARKVNVAGTRSVLEACEGETVRKLIFKSSSHIYGSSADDPAFFSEDMEPAGSSRADLVEAERLVAEFAGRNRGIAVSVLRFADALVGEPGSSHLMLLSLPIVPAVLGFDPRLQFVHDEDVVGAFAHVTRSRLPGTFNVAGDGVLALSEVVSLLGKPLLPVLPPWGFTFAVRQLRRVGLRVPVDLARQLRHGRGLDNRRLKAAGFRYRYTTRETVLKLRAHQRLRPLLGSGDGEYHYDRELEEFLRRSPSVRSSIGETVTDGAEGDELTEAELLEAISSLDAPGLEQLRTHELAHRRRKHVLDALEHNLARKQDPGTLA
jgi:UDP-glucose 4-epimerase